MENVQMILKVYMGVCLHHKLFTKQLRKLNIYQLEKNN